MTTMKALEISEWNGRFHIVERPIPKPLPTEVLIKVKACGVGLTLTNVRAGYLGGTLPRIIGHEVGGIVEKAGSMVRTCKPGDRVCVSFYLTCGYCAWCINGQETLCENLKGYVGTTIDGGFAEYIKVPERNCIHIPDQVGFVDAGITTDAVATNWHVFKERAMSKPNDVVLVVGAGGGLGIHCVQMAKVFGAYVIGVDRSYEKLKIAMEYGCNLAINTEDGDITRQILDATNGRGVGCAVDMVGTSQTMEDSIRLLSRGGILVVVGVPRAVEFIKFNTSRLVFDEIKLTGSRYATRQEIKQSLKLVERNLIKPVVLNKFVLEEANEVFEKIEKMEFIGRAAFVL
jgi:propanol-preferring alcohol dehydrogenase